MTSVSRGALLALVTTVIAASSGCGASSASQCNVGASGDADCARVLGLSADLAICDNGTCRPKGSAQTQNTPDGGGGGCVSTEQCTADNGGQPSICREPGVKPCVPLTNDICTVSGDGWKQAAHPIFVGVLLDTTIGADNDAIQPYDQTVQKDIQLAEAEWLSATNGGLNVTGERQPIVGIYCNIKLDPETTRRAFDFVTLGVGAPAVITEYPSDALAFIDAAKDRGTFVYLTEFGSDEVSLTGKINGRVFTSEPPIDYSLPLVERWVKDVEASIRSERGLTSADKLKVVTLASRDVDASSSAYLDTLKATLQFNGQLAKDQPDQYSEVNPILTPEFGGDFIATANGVVEARPDIIVTLEARDFHLWYMPLIEANWPAAVPRPRYVTTESAAFVRRYAVSVGGNNALRRRASGVWLFIDPASPSSPLVDDFLSRYHDRYKEENVDFVITGVDAWYATAYGIAAALTSATVSSANLSGVDIGKAMARLVGGAQTVKVLPGEISPGLAYLQQGTSVDLVGLDGLLDWDPVNGAAGVDASVYCVGHPGSGIELVDTGLVYRYKTKAFEGAADLGLCP